MVGKRSPKPSMGVRLPLPLVKMNEPDFAFKMRQNPVFLCIYAGYQKIIAWIFKRQIC